MREIVGHFELDPIELSDGSTPLEFRIEILRLPGGRFTARLLRWEMYEVKPFDLRDSGGIAHEEVLVADILPGTGEVDAASPDAVLREVLDRLRNQLGDLPQLR